MWLKCENKEKAGISEIWRDRSGKVFYSKSNRKPLKGFYTEEQHDLVCSYKITLIP